MCGLNGREVNYELSRYLEWSKDCIHAIDFSRTALSLLSLDVELVRLFSLEVSGLLRVHSDSKPSKEQIVDCASSLINPGVFIFDTSFECKGRAQLRDYSSRVSIVAGGGKPARLRFVHQASQSDVVPEIAHEAALLFHKASLNGAFDFVADQWDVSCSVPKVSIETIDFMGLIVERLGSGKVFGHQWDASIVDRALAQEYGFHYYNRIVEAGLKADEFRINVRFQLRDIQGLELSRQLCEGDASYVFPLGTFRYQKKKAGLGIYITKEGYRLALTLKDEPTEAEWERLESAIGTAFQRMPSHEE